MLNISVCVPDGGVAHLAVLGAALSRVPAPLVLSSAFSQIQAWREAADSLFLFDVPGLTDAFDWSIVAFNIELIRFMSIALATTVQSERGYESEQFLDQSDALKSGRSLSAGEWDAVLCGGVSWLQTVSDSLAHCPFPSTPAMVALATAACELIGGVAEVVGVALPRRPGDFPPELGAEWRDVFGPSVFGVLLPMFARVATATAGGKELGSDPAVRAPCVVMLRPKLEFLLNLNFQPKFQFCHFIVSRRFVASLFRNCKVWIILIIRF